MADPKISERATIARPISTIGEVFADGSMIEMIGGIQDGKPRLMLWDGAKELVGSVVEHRGRLYEPASINSSVLRELTLPTRSSPHGSTREFLMETCKLLANLVDLEEKPVALVGRFVLCSALVDAISIAPALTIVGPDTARGNRDGRVAGRALFAGERCAIHVSHQPVNR